MKPARKLAPKKAKPLTSRIHCAEGLTAQIPEALRAFKITDGWLFENGACAEGRRRFNAKFPKGCTYTKLRVAIADAKEPDFETWLIAKLGGDVATAGDMGTATAGDRGTATAGYRGTATAGYRGTATAGYMGTATAGDRGTATAGEEGVISIEFYDALINRFRRKVAAVDGVSIKPKCKYRLNEAHEFEEVTDVVEAGK